MVAAATRASNTASPWWKSKARMAMGAAVVMAIVLVAVLVPTLSKKQGKAGSGSGAVSGGLVTDKGGAGDLANVVNALLVANTPTDLPADMAEKQAGTNTNTNTTAPATPVRGSKAARLGGLTTLAWPALTQPGAAANPSICYPMDGAEVVAASKAESKCTVIMLTNGGGKPYDITQQMNITSEYLIDGGKWRRGGREKGGGCLPASINRLPYRFDRLTPIPRLPPFVCLQQQRPRSSSGTPSTCPSSTPRARSSTASSRVSDEC
jgi:hypothetical protein